jgi:hypothetical protein
VCPGELTACGVLCVNTMASIDHCGGCNQPCPVDTPCVNGRCL